jgi:hypothetical protein
MPPDVSRRPEPKISGALIPTPVVALAVVGLAVLLYVGFVASRSPSNPGGLSAIPSGNGGDTPATAPASPVQTPLLVGLTILSPADGAVVATKKVLVIGTAPPGLTITQDISLGLDRHTQVDGTGHWAMEMDLVEGDNQMTFRIGDDKSTARAIHVVFQPPGVQ